VKGQELKVQLWQGERSISVVQLFLNSSVLKERIFVWVDGHRVDLVHLTVTLLESGEQDLLKDMLRVLFSWVCDLRRPDV
jgi:hypothetical protein